MTGRDFMKKILKNNKSTENNGEFGLTAALSSMIDKCGISGIVLDGEMFDIGNTEAYREAIQRFS